MSAAAGQVIISSPGFGNVLNNFSVNCPVSQAGQEQGNYPLGREVEIYEQRNSDPYLFAAAGN